MSTGIWSNAAWGIEETTGYHPKTTFWSDFSIADRFGVKAVEDTYRRAFEEWRADHVYLTELVMVLNWKIWQWFDRNSLLAKTYDKLWRLADQYACENLKGDELRYFYQTTD